MEPEQPPEMKAVADDENIRGQFRKWCFTLNQPTDQEMKTIESLLGSDDVRYSIGRDIGPQFQCYVAFFKPKQFETVKGLIGERANLELARALEADFRRHYSEGNFREWGQFEEPGTQSDLSVAAKKIVDGRKETDVAREHAATFVRHWKGLRQLALVALDPGPRTFKTTVHVFHGSSGTGKSRTAFQMARGDLDSVYYKPSGPWWDGYQYQPLVIFDNYNEEIEYSQLLQICDRYPFQVPVRGGSVNFVSQHIYFTSHSHPKNWYRSGDICKGSFMRRVETIIQFKDKPFGDCLLNRVLESEPTTYLYIERIHNITFEFPI